MKKAVLLLLAGVFLLSAVQWQEELISGESPYYYMSPLLKLGEERHAHVLYLQAYYDWEAESTAAWIKVASNATGSWTTRKVVRLSKDFYSYDPDLMFPPYGFDVDFEGNTYIVFFDFASEEETNLFFACDSSGEFVVDTLTNDMNIQVGPAVKLDSEGQLKLAYLEVDSEDWSRVQIRYGTIRAGNLDSELVIEMSDQFLFFAMDLVFSDDGTPHLFYSRHDEDSDPVLCHAAPSGIEPAGWNCGPLGDSVKGIFPCVVSDDRKGFCMAYLNGEHFEEDFEDIHYLTLDGSDLEDELVQESVSFDCYFTPALALNPDGVPFVVSVNDYSDFYYTVKTDAGWIEEKITNTPELDEAGGVGHFFAIDSQGYGHLAYVIDDYFEEVYQVFYAKSLEPLLEGIAESSPSTRTTLRFESGEYVIHFSLHVGGLVYLDLYDASGRRVKNLASGTFCEGEHVVPIKSGELSAGVYFAQGFLAGQPASVKIIFTR
ncbi:hypothetical protein JXM67_02310 [candidate division WOR-3 bacterium]|nr:hypothetical protein [candidate division WOR-3 bacterium]